jgi:adenine deaminase
MRIELKAGLAGRLGRVALGKEPADLMITRGNVVNVYTGEVLKEHQILTAGGRIAYVGPENEFPTGPGTVVIDAGGQVIIPGMIDAHTHIDALVKVGEFVRLSLPRGTTTVITECSTPANAMGAHGVKVFLNQFKNQPQRIFATAPAISFLCSDRANGIKSISAPEMIQLLEQHEVLGLGEVYWSKLLNGEPDEKLIEIIGAAAALGKTVEGHGAGAKNKKLAALAAHGIDSCHEPITAGEVLERLRLGLFAMIREGSIRREMEAVIKPLCAMSADLRRAVLVTDGLWPVDLIRCGHMDYILQKAIDMGIDPVTSVRMVTLNAAEHFHLGDDLGGIAPGKCADMVVIPDLKTIEPRLVICRGTLVAREGKMLVSPAAEDLPDDAYRCVNLPPLQPGFFRVPAVSPAAKIKVRAIEQVTSILNRETTADLPVIDGEVSAAGIDDILKVAVLDRFSGAVHGSTGFIKGYGLCRGALASSFSFDGGNLVVIGSNDFDMAAAVNRIRDLQGGIVYCCDGQVVEEVPLPVFGAVSGLAGPEVSRRLLSVKQALRAAGCRSEDPLLTVFTINFTPIPSLRLLAGGYWLAKENRVVDKFI